MTKQTNKKNTQKKKQTLSPTFKSKIIKQREKLIFFKIG